jgi:hypothetical protein
VELGRHVFQQIIRMDENEYTAYLCMYNILADAGMHEEAQHIELMGVGRGKKMEIKKTGIHKCWI